MNRIFRAGLIALGILSGLSSGVAARDAAPGYKVFSNALLLRLPVKTGVCARDGKQVPFTQQIIGFTGALHNGDPQSFRMRSWSGVIAAAKSKSRPKAPRPISIRVSSVLGIVTAQGNHFLALDSRKSPKAYLPACEARQSRPDTLPDGYPTILLTQESVGKAMDLLVHLRQTRNLPMVDRPIAFVFQAEASKKPKRVTYLDLMRAVFATGRAPYLDHWSEPTAIGLEGEVELSDADRLAMFYPGSARAFEAVVKSGKEELRAAVRPEWLRVRLPAMLQDVDLTDTIRFQDDVCRGPARRIQGDLPTYEFICAAKPPFDMQIGALKPVRVEDWTTLLDATDLKVDIAVSLVGDWPQQQRDFKLTTTLARIEARAERIVMNDAPGCHRIIAPGLGESVLNPVQVRLTAPCMVVKTCAVEQAPDVFCIASRDGDPAQIVVLRRPVAGK